MIYSSWDIETWHTENGNCRSFFALLPTYGVWRTEFFVILDRFLPFNPTSPSNNPKNQNFEKMKKLAGDIIILYRCTINDKWCKVPEIWRVSDRSFCHFGLFYALLPPPNNLKYKSFEKLKKNPGDIIILHWCTKNHDHMLYCYWYMAHNRCNWYFSF